MQSIVAAALARVGRSVLHVDRYDSLVSLSAAHPYSNEYYGEYWASVSLVDINNLGAQAAEVEAADAQQVFLVCVDGATTKLFWVLSDLLTGTPGWSNHRTLVVHLKL